MQTKLILALAIAIAAALVTTPAFAQTAHQLVFTEDSTGLSVTYDGTALPVTFEGGTGGTQQWLVNLQPANANITSPDISWIEPENPNRFNNVGFTSVPGPVQVASDVTLPFASPLPDEATVVVGKNADGSLIEATFDDDAAPAEVPDTGSTLGLLSLALAGLFGASRLRSLRAA